MVQFSAPPPNGKERYRRRFVLIVCVVLVILFLLMIRHLIVAIMVAMLLWWATRSVYGRLLVVLKGRKSAAAGLSVLASFIVIIVPVIVLLTLLAVDAASLFEQAKTWYEPLRPEIEGRLNQLTRGRTVIILGQEIGGPQVARVMEHLSGQLGTFGVTIITGMVSGVAQATLLLLVTLYALYFFYLDGQSFLDWLQRALPLTHEQSNVVFKDFFLTTKATLSSFIVIGSVQGGLGGLGMWMAGIPAPVFWSIVMAILSAFPVLGPFVVLMPASVLLILSGKVWTGVGLLLWTLLVVSTIDNILRPYLINRGTQLHELLVFLGILGGIAVFGFFGILLGPVIVSLLRAILRLYVEIYGQPVSPPSESPPPT